MVLQKINNKKEWEKFIEEVYNEASDIDFYVADDFQSTEIGDYEPTSYPFGAVYGDYYDGCRHSYMTAMIFYPDFLSGT